MTYLPGDAYCAQFTTQRSDTGVASDADSTPTATATRNGSDDGGFSLTVTKITTGRYKVTGTIPSGGSAYEAGDSVQVSVTATVNSVTGTAIIDQFIIDTKRNADLADFDPSADGVNVEQWAGTAVSLSSSTQLPEVDAASISDSTTAADNVQANIGNLDAAITTRSDFDPTSDAIIVGQLTADAIADFFATNSGAAFGDAVAGSLVKEIADNAAGVGDWSTTEKQQIRQRLAIDGSQANPSATGELTDIKTILQAGTIR